MTVAAEPVFFFKLFRLTDELMEHIVFEIGNYA